MKTTVRRLDMLDGLDGKAVPSTSARAMCPAMQNDSDPLVTYADLAKFCRFFGFCLLIYRMT